MAPEVRQTDQETPVAGEAHEAVNDGESNMGSLVAREVKCNDAT
jgi:hypothetical protein